MSRQPSKIGAFGSHVFDGLRWMLGEGEVRDGSVRTAIAERPDGEGVMHACTAEDSFTARLSFASGATALVDTTFAGHAHRPERITVFGDDGMIEVTGTTEIRVWNAKGEQVHRFEPFDGDPHLPSMRPWARAVATALAEDRQIAPSFRDGLACAELIGQLRERAE